MNMTKAVLPSLAVLVLMGCDAATEAVSDSISDSIADTIAPDPAKRVSSLLMNNDPSVCAEDDAIQTALGAANRDYPTYLQNGGREIRVDTISATEIKKDIHEITCSSTIYYSPSDDRELSQSFRFKLRPTLGEREGFVAEVPNRSAWLAIHTHMDGGNAVRRLNESLAAHTNRGGAGDNPPAAPGSDLTEDVNASTGSGNSRFFDLKNDSIVDARCRVTINGKSVIQGACTVNTKDNRAIVFSNDDGCTIDINGNGSNGKAELSAYRNQCPLLDDRPDPIYRLPLGKVSRLGDCWVSDDATICATP